MTHPLFEKHRTTVNSALEAIANRGYWSPYSEIPSPKIYGESAASEGKVTFDALLGKNFDLHQPSQTGWVGEEVSPYGVPLMVKYPLCDHEALLSSAEEAMRGWQAVGAQARIGICAEILERLNKKSFEIAHAVMMTTGQGWMMSFQAGSAHAQDRGLEALAYAWREQSFIPQDTIWNKPQGKHPSQVVKKHFEIVGRGVALVIGCSTFPTWNTYPGLFAALATGNAVIVKPHNNAVLPVAITVKTIRDVLSENAIDPNLVTLFVTENPAKTKELAMHPRTKSIDYTGSSEFGHWLTEHCKQARVYAELAGVNNTVIESTNAYKAMLANLAFTLSLYSGQMCTTTQAIIVPAQGIDTDEGRKTYDQFCSDLAGAVNKFLSKPEVALSILGAVQSKATLERIETANSGKIGSVILASQKLVNPEFVHASVHTPVILACDEQDEAFYMQERFGPISFIVKTQDIHTGVALSEKIVATHGALTVGVYSTQDSTIDAMTQATWRVKAALSINLTSGVFVNQSAAFSDFHATSANPASNASYTNSAFVADRFVVVQRRYHVQENSEK